MEKIYQVSDKRVMFSQEMDPNIFKRDLPPGFYTTAYNDREGVFLKETNPLTIPSKIYGDSNSRLGRILNSFEHATKNLGVLLYGNSGSGKSLLAKQVCIELAKTHPVIIVNSNHIGFLNNYIENIKERCVFFIDEFEKMFDKKEEQSYMLTVIDGATTKSNLFLFTANNKDMVNNFFFNRPSRIRYAYEYSYLPEDVIKEVLADRLDNKDRVNDIFNAIMRFDDPSFDVICELASEANLYPDYTVKQLMDGYNSRMISNRLSDLDCQFLIDGENIEKFVQPICEKYGVNLSTSYCINFTDYDIDDLQEMIYSSSSRKTNFCLGEYNIILNKENTVIRNDRYLYFNISNMKFNYVNKDLYISGIKLSIEGIKDFMYLISSSIARAVKTDDTNSFIKEIDKEILPQLINKEFGIVAKPMKKYKSSQAF